MSNVIHLLPDSVANQIAAGEVIQRPASVLKELVENAIDAGATSVKVAVTDAGRTIIQVIDDGCGMSETDARLAFERHATSKIREASDLYSLHTMGFRGEALASIAAVAQVELFTRRPTDELGVHIEISGSNVTNQEPITTAVGSRFVVRNLFFNIPARRRFLKSDAAEMRHLSAEFLRIALAHTNITLSLTSNGTPIYTFPAGNMKQRVSQVAGRALAQELLPIEIETSVANIKGFIGSPLTAKKSSSDQYFFANDRFMKNPYLHKAVIDAYKNIIPPELTPAYFIYISVDPQCIDVNVHPQKTEIKFDNDASIWQLLNVGVKECLGKFNIMPSIDFDANNQIDIPTYSPNTLNINSNNDFYNPFERESNNDFHVNNNYHDNSLHSSNINSKSIDGWENLYKSAANTYNDINIDASASNDDIIESKIGKLPLDIEQNESKAIGHLFQLHNKYIVATTEQGLMVIDQHRAHERIQYERIFAMTQTGNCASQQLLFPEYVAMGIDDACIINELSDELSRVGFDLKYDDTLGQMIINAVPALIETSNVQSLLEAIIFDSRNGEINISGSVIEYVAKIVAKQTALPYGKALADDEMLSLYEKLFDCKSPSISPSGKNIFYVISNDEIKSNF